MEGLKVTEYEVSTGGRAEFLAAVVSDTHEMEPTPVIEEVRKVSPDIILLAGDIVEAKTRISARLHDGERGNPSFELINGLCKVAPVIYGLGNHEGNLTRNQKLRIDSTDAELLIDSYKRMKINGDDVCIGAVSPNGEGADEMLRDFRRQDCFRVLICHEPQKYISLYRDERDDIAIAGHAHGGQWRVFGRGVFAPGQGLFPKYTRGFYGNLLVSAGAHNSEVIPRINNPCEILSVRFVK